MERGDEDGWKTVTRRNHDHNSYDLIQTIGPNITLFTENLPDEMDKTWLDNSLQEQVRW